MSSDWRAVGATVRGTSHLSRDLPNQDAWGSAESESASCVAASDGHGGKLHFRSASGARIAVEEALAEFRLLGGKEIPLDADVRQAGETISERWNARVRADLESNPFRNEDLEPIEQEGRV
jgi:hypothetical protein